MDITLHITPYLMQLPQWFGLNDVRRPYVPISGADYQRLMAEQYDVYEMGTELVTLGNADNGYALMPILPASAAKLRRQHGGS